MKHEMKLIKVLIAIFAFAFCFGVHSIIALKLEPGSSMITSPKENVNHKVKTQNVKFLNCLNQINYKSYFIFIPLNNT